jgi:uncharacterized protein YjdB
MTPILKIKNKMAKTQIKAGVVHDGKGKQFTNLTDALANETTCGCGIDCKEGLISLPNYNSVSGDVDGFFALYLVDGAIVVSPIATARAAIKAFKCNSLVSATGVTLSGCLTGTNLANLATRQLTATVLPAGASQAGTWTSSAPTVATVSSTGLVTATALDGTAIITFTSTDGDFTATCSITVA